MVTGFRSYLLSLVQKMEDNYMFLDNSLLRLLLLENEKESWVSDINSTRETQGEFTLLFPDLIKDGQQFFNYSECCQKHSTIFCTKSK